MITNGKSIFITGINGFIGSAAAKFYLDKGYHVVGLVKEENNKTQEDLLSRCTVVRGDIRDRGVIRETISKYEVDFVLHLASMPIVRICNSDPESTYSVNVMGVVNLLESIRSLKNKPEKIICFTSDKSYGPLSTLPYTEDMNPTFGDTYSTSKACQDLIARSYANSYDLPVCVVRSGNVYGPGDFNFSRLIPNNALRGLRGQELTLYSGVANFVRDFVYIDDEISAINKVFESGVVGQAYNVGGTGPVKIKSVIESIVKILDSGVEVDYPEKDFDEIKKQWLDDTKLKKLGWEPKVDLEEGLKRTIEWYKKYA